MNVSQWMIVGLLLCGVASLPAQTDTTQQVVADTSNTFDAHEVVVSATRWNEDAASVPREIITITPQQIQRNAPSTTADAIALTGGVHVQKSQLGGGSPMLRGYAANAVLMVVDGVRVNNAIFRSGNLQNVIMMDALALDGIEVLFGPGSVQYGSDALGGVMNFRTRTPYFYEGGTLFTKSLNFRAGSAANEYAGSFAFDVSSKDFASSTVLSFSSFGDLTGGGQMMEAYPEFGLRPWYVERFGNTDSIVVNPEPTNQVPTGYNQFNVLQRFRVNVAENITLGYTGLFTTSSDIPRYDRLQQTRNVEPRGEPRFAEWAYGPQLWTLHALNLTSTQPTALWDELVAVGSFQFYREQRIERRFTSPDRFTQSDAVLIGSVNLDMQKKLSDNATREIDLYYGFESVVNDVQSSAEQRNINNGITSSAPTRYPNGGSVVWQMAAYVQTRFDVSRNVKLSGGVRYTWYRLSSSVSDTSTYPLIGNDLGFTTQALSGSIGATWQASNSVRFFGNVSNGFRAPNVDDVAKVFDSAPGIIVVPNSGLQPEKAITAEAGVSFTTPALRTSANVYHTWATDAIEVRKFSFNGLDTIDVGGVPSAVFANVNVGSANIVGLSIMAETILLSDVVLRGNVTYTQGTDNNNKPLRHIPPVFGNVVMAYSQDRFNANLEFWWAAAKPFQELPPEEQAKVGINYTADGTPAWRRFDMSAEFRAFENVTAQLRVENLFDLNYHTFASAISAPGRNFVASLRVTW